jgi:hypothetical protein
VLRDFAVVITRGSGACIALLRGIPRNAAECPARILIVLSPGIQALEMFRHFDGGSARPLPPQKIATIAGRYDVHFV